MHRAPNAPQVRSPVGQPTGAKSTELDPDPKKNHCIHQARGIHRPIQLSFVSFRHRATMNHHVKPLRAPPLGGGNVTELAAVSGASPWDDVLLPRVPPHRAPADTRRAPNDLDGPAGTGGCGMAWARDFPLSKTQGNPPLASCLEGRLFSSARLPEAMGDGRNVATATVVQSQRLTPQGLQDPDPRLEHAEAGPGVWGPASMVSTCITQDLQSDRSE